MFILRGLAAAMAAGAGVGAVWGYVTGGAGGFGFFAIFLGIGIGWCVGEAISAATNRKRSPVLQGIAIAGCLLAYAVHNLVAGDAPLPTGDLWGYIVTGVAAVYAASRLSRGF